MALNKNLAAKDRKRLIKHAKRQSMENGGRNRRREEETRNMKNHSPRGESYNAQGEGREGVEYKDPT